MTYVVKCSLLFIYFFCISYSLNGQEIDNKAYFSNFLGSSDKSLLIVGENHASAAGSTIYPSLIKYLHKESGLNTLLIEFGPSEAYFYQKYLETGDEKHLNYTIYAGGYQNWREAWREIYKFNQTLDEPLELIGVDFDRARTMAYGLFSMFMAYPEKPAFVDSLMSVIKTDEFYNTYTIGYPTEKDKAWTADTKALLNANSPALEEMLKPGDFKRVKRIIANTATGYDSAREQALASNTLQIINESDKKRFLMLIGRSHAYLDAIYDDEPRLATMLKERADFNVLTGVILHENSQLMSRRSDTTKVVTLHETRNKIPWKEHSDRINELSKGALTVVPLDGALKPLASYTEYILVARDQTYPELLK